MATKHNRPSRQMCIEMLTAMRTDRRTDTHLGMSLRAPNGNGSRRRSKTISHRQGAKGSHRRCHVSCGGRLYGNACAPSRQQCAQTTTAVRSDMCADMCMGSCIDMCAFEQAMPTNRSSRLASKNESGTCGHVYVRACAPCRAVDRSASPGGHVGTRAHGPAEHVDAFVRS